MFNKMSYKGYTARIDFDDRDDIFVGRVLGVSDTISFHADSVENLRHEFRVSIDDYLKYCREHGHEPGKIASGKLMLRVPPEIHTASLIAAKAAGKSLNQWATEALAQAVRR